MPLGESFTYSSEPHSAPTKKLTNTKYRDDNNNSENISIENLPSISATFKAVLIDELNENTSQTFATNKEYQKSMIEKYYKLLKAQNDEFVDYCKDRAEHLFRLFVFMYSSSK